MQPHPTGEEVGRRGIHGLVEGGVGEGLDSNEASTYEGLVRFGFWGGLEVIWLEQLKWGQAGSLLG